jgi:transposase
LTKGKKEKGRVPQMEQIKEEALKKIKQYFPKSRGKARVDDRRVISGIVYVLRNGLKWKDAPREYGPYKTLYNRFVRWSRMGVFAKILQKLSKEGTKVLMIDATHLKAHRTAASLAKGGPHHGTLGEQKEAFAANYTSCVMALEDR